MPLGVPLIAEHRHVSAVQPPQIRHRAWADSAEITPQVPLSDEPFILARGVGMDEGDVFVVSRKFIQNGMSIQGRGLRSQDGVPAYGADSANRGVWNPVWVARPRLLQISRKLVKPGNRVTPGSNFSAAASAVGGISIFLYNCGAHFVPFGGVLHCQLVPPRRHQAIEWVSDHQPLEIVLQSEFLLILWYVAKGNQPRLTFELVVSNRRPGLLCGIVGVEQQSQVRSAPDLGHGAEE